MSTENPYSFPASQLLAQLDPQAYTTRSQITNDMRNLLATLGSPINPTGLDNGTFALVALCQFLREHGGAIAALSKADAALHGS